MKDSLIGLLGLAIISIIGLAILAVKIYIILWIFNWIFS